MLLTAKLRWQNSLWYPAAIPIILKHTYPINVVIHHQLGAPPARMLYTAYNPKNCIGTTTAHSCGNANVFLASCLNDVSILVRAPCYRYI